MQRNIQNTLVINDEIVLRSHSQGSLSFKSHPIELLINTSQTKVGYFL